MLIVIAGWQACTHIRKLFIASCRSLEVFTRPEVKCSQFGVTLILNDQSDLQPTFRFGKLESLNVHQTCCLLRSVTNAPGQLDWTTVNLNSVDVIRIGRV